MLRKEEVRKTAILGVEQVHILHGLVDHVVVFRRELRAAVRQQQLDKGIEEFDVALGRFKRQTD